MQFDYMLDIINEIIIMKHVYRLQSTFDSNAFLIDYLQFCACQLKNNKKYIYI